MHEDPVVTPDKFRGVLCDDVKRRHFILDADVKEHTMALASIDAVRNQLRSYLLLSNRIALFVP